MECSHHLFLRVWYGKHLVILPLLLPAADPPQSAHRDFRFLDLNCAHK
jgi:hypothetical protein